MDTVANVSEPVHGIEATVADSKIFCRHVTKIFHSQKQWVTALQDINIEILENEFICIVGPSGCGKSTLLRLLAGFDEVTEGDIVLNDRILSGPGADRGMVFQAYTLFPWMTVEKNIRFGLDLKKMDKTKANEITEKYLDLIGLRDFRKSYPKELSGGMKQRVAIARALANSPEVLLMDEPFGALDPDTKSLMQLELRAIWEKEKPTIIFITHDIEEAVFLSQRVYVMATRPGRVIANVPVYLPYRRDLDLKDTPEFIALRRRIHGLFHAEDAPAVD